MNNLLAEMFLNAYDSVLQIEPLTGDFQFLKKYYSNFPLHKKMNPKDFFKNHSISEFVHPNDLYLFEIHFTQAALQAKVQQNKNGLIFAYRFLSEGRYIWNSVNFFCLKKDTKIHVLLCQKCINRENTDMLETLERFNSKIYKVIKCNLSDKTFHIIRQRKPETNKHTKHFKSDPRLPHEWMEEAPLIHSEDFPQFLHYINHGYITDYFDAGKDELSFFYRRKSNGIFRWVRLVISKSTEYSFQNKIFIYIIEDIDFILRNLLARQEDTHHLDYSNGTNHSIEIYNENLTHVLSYFTDRYIDFYMIDLKRDLYIIYKIRPDTIAGDTPYTGSYSEMSHRYVKENLGKEQEEMLLSFATPDAFRKMLIDKSSIEFSFTHITGQRVKTICTKIASEHGIPTKVICCTVPCQSENLLKVKTFGNFEVYDSDGKRITFSRKQSKQLLAYLIDKQGYPVATKDIVVELLEKPENDKTAIKYVSTIAKWTISELETAGYQDIIIKEWNSLRVNTDKIDCDYYHLINGDMSYMHLYHNEYMKEYSWAEETNAELLHFSLQ